MELYTAFACIIFVLWIIWRKRHISVFKKLGIPGPEPNLVFGNLLELYRKGPIKCHEEWIKKYGKTVGYFYGMKPTLLIADPDILKKIFIKDFPKFINRETFNPLARYEPHNKNSQSVLILPGKKWKEVRSVLTPTFTAAKMKQMAGSMNSSIETLINILKENAKNGKVFDAYDTYQRVTMDVIAKTAFGVRADVQTNANSKIMKITQILFGARYRDPLVFTGLAFPFLRRTCHKTQEFILGIWNGGSKPTVSLRRGITTVINHRREHPQGAKCDLLQLMIDSKIPTGVKEVDTNMLEIGNAEHEGKVSKEDETNKAFRRMTEDEIRSSAFTVLLAGFETTSTALAFTTYLIAKHPDVQEKLYKEIDMLIQNGEKLEYGTISKLQYLDKVLNESMRIYPPVTLFTNRYAMEDVDYGNIKIPKGMLIQAPVYYMHHAPEFWENPETFDPERFNDKTNINGIVYMPFGVGPRNCLGMRFAQVESKLVLANVLHKFKISLADSQENMRLHLKLRTISPKDGVQVKLELRQDE